MKAFFSPLTTFFQFSGATPRKLIEAGYLNVFVLSAIVIHTTPQVLVAGVGGWFSARSYRVIQRR